MGHRVSRRSMLSAIIVVAVLALAMAAMECDASDDRKNYGPMEQGNPLGNPPADNFQTMGNRVSEPLGHPPALDNGKPKEPAHDGPAIVFDASGISLHEPDRIRGFADALEKKERMDDENHSFAILDPSADANRGDALLKTLESMGFQVVSSVQEIGGQYSLLEISADVDASSAALYRFLQYMDSSEAELCDLIYSMIREMEGRSSDERSASPSREDESLVPDVPDSSAEGEDDGDESETVYVDLMRPSAVDVYLRAQVFDGGTFFSL